MNPYYKKYCEFEQTDENVKFTDIHRMNRFDYEVFSMEEQMKKNISKINKMKLDMNKFCGHTKWHNVQMIHNEKLKLEEEYKKFKSPFFFITINPKPETDFNEFKSAVEDISTWCWVNKCYWVFEQRGNIESEMGKGFHAHILIEEHNIEKGKCNTQMINKFKKFVGIVSDNTINVQNKKREWLQDKLEYIMGEKLDEGKPEKQEIDKIWRLKRELQSWYSFDTLTDKRRVSNNKGGRRNGSGVKLGSKRGKYKCKKNNLLLEDCKNEIKIIKEKKVLEF